MRFLMILALCVVAAPAHAEPTVRVIVNAKNPIARLDRRVLVEAFLKKRTRWDDDSVIQPVDLGQKSHVREQFSHDVLGRDIAAVRRYWAQLVFSGRGVPTPELGSEAEVVKYVAGHPGAIGYISSATALGATKVIEVD